MFFIIKKEKIKSYLISVGTVIALLGFSIAIQNNATSNTISTGSNIAKFPILKINTEEKVIGLSINCIENMNNIDDILDTLSKTKSTATFFVTGEIADKYPDEIKKIIDNGNEIGNLSNTYKSLKKLSKEEIIKSINECNSKIEKITNDEPCLFRAPYGEFSNSIIEIVQSLNMEIIGWSIDTLDSNELSSDEIWEIIEENISNGSIVLAHNEYIGEKLENLIYNINKKGFEVKNISGIMYKNNYEIDSNGAQIQVNQQKINKN